MDYAYGTGGRKVVIALRAGENVIDGMLEAFEKSGLKNAAITTFYGSLSKLAYAYPVPDESRYYGFRYGDTIQLEGIIEAVSGQGMICRNEQGEIMYHLHAAFCDDTGKVMAGHIMRQENVCLVAMEIFLEETEGIEMKREFSQLVGGAILTVNPLDKKN